MAKFWVDFHASVQVEAESEEEAKETFWEDVFDCSKYDYADIDVVEEIIC